MLKFNAVYIMKLISNFFYCSRFQYCKCLNNFLPIIIRNFPWVKHEAFGYAFFIDIQNAQPTSKARCLDVEHSKHGV